MTSLTLHAAAFAAWMAAMKATPTITHNLENVSIIQVHTPRPVQAAPKPPAQSRFDFLKMALPTIPKIETPMAAQLKLPEHELKMNVAPKLQERKRLDAAPKLNLDLQDTHGADALAKLDMTEPAHRVKALAALPKLEEVGARRVKNLPQAIKLEEARQEALQTAALEGMAIPTHAHTTPAMAQKLIDEAPAAERPSLTKQVLSALPQDRGLEQPMQMRAAPDDIAKKMEKAVLAPPKRAGAAALGGEQKKGVEIEGPLKNRTVVSADIPQFPDWLKKYGTAEAAVRLNFCVDPDGSVVHSSIRPDQASGYGRLDREAEDALKNWRFAALGQRQRQCGIITFRYELE